MHHTPAVSSPPENIANSDRSTQISLWKQIAKPKADYHSGTALTMTAAAVEGQATLDPMTGRGRKGIVAQPPKERA
jgi:hypothetical protein